MTTIAWIIMGISWAVVIGSCVISMRRVYKSE